MAFSHIRDDVSSKQANKQASKQSNKKTGFTVDLICWGSLRLAPIVHTLGYGISIHENITHVIQ